ncbi:hypothetical protein [Rhodococcus phenolicus]|uniref:hypothetical protein n=1 Tax=Rhodococcus phenolicus TaxID=263849 RepID=UPI00082E547A|nr:hypothetical protein [Rhodococcus phenolicus]
MATDPTTPEGRAELITEGRRRLAAYESATAWSQEEMNAADEWHGWQIANGEELLDALDDAECEIERLRGDLVIERRRAGAAEAALDRVRKYAREQRRMAEGLHSIGRPYDALPYDNPATALERIIGDRT